MRMWLVDTKILCRKHLLGEHVECHMFLSALRDKKKLDGYFDNDLFEPSSLIARHDDLVCEMTDRGYMHKSTMDSVFVDMRHLPYVQRVHKIDREKSLADLLGRCADCRARHEAAKKERE